MNNHIVSDSIVHYAKTVIEETVRKSNPHLSERLNDLSHAGVFVTIRVGGKLRGCIGCLDEKMTFQEAIRFAASRAATRDTRFESIREIELRDIDVDVTVLQPMEAITSVTQVEIGKHGMMIEFEGKRGLLLPQVAVERSWTSEQFLDALCEKASLDRSVLAKPEAKLYRFPAVCHKETQPLSGVLMKDHHA